MPLLSALQLATTLAAIGLGVVLFLATPGRAPRVRLALASLPLTAGYLLWQWFAAFGPFPYGGPWSAARLVPAVSLLHGYRPYYPAGEGPVLGWIYPPGALLAYLPAAAVGHPQAAIVAGRLLTWVYYYAPAAWLLLSGPENPPSRPWRLLLLVTFALLTSQSPALAHGSVEVHADTPALALGAVALGLMARSREGDQVKRGFSALAATLSVWSKQLAVPVLVLLPLWVVVREGLRSSWRFTLWWAFAVAGVSTIAVGVLGWDALVFNIVTVPSRHPWRFSSPPVIAGAVLGVEREHLVLVVLLATGLLTWVIQREGARDSAGPPGSLAWPLFLLAGVAEIPFAVLGYIKVGGDFNNLAFSLYYLSLGATLLLARLLPDADREPAPWLCSLVLGVNLVLALVGSQRLTLEMMNPVLPYRDARVAARFLRDHPGEAYFPWNPLEHLIVDGHASHFEYGLYDRQLAGVPVRDEQFFGYVPPRARYVVYPLGLDVGDRYILLRAGGEWRPVVLRELPGWLCFERPDRGPVFPQIAGRQQNGPLRAGE